MWCPRLITPVEKDKFDLIGDDGVPQKRRTIREGIHNYVIEDSSIPKSANAYLVGSEYADSIGHFTSYPEMGDFHGAPHPCMEDDGASVVEIYNLPIIYFKIKETSD